MFSWLSLVMGIAYIVLGIVVMMKKWFFIQLDDMASYALGGVLVFYGVFRIGRAIYQIKSKGE
ncbi:MAG: C4-dicarboxylate ABC transporter [Flavobacteriales bacterium]|nr:MAG: C4-dicarboxylate ABC transporter [Flavobacteriales bacterium]